MKLSFVEVVNMKESTGLIIFIVGVLLLMTLTFVSPLMTVQDKFISVVLPIMVITAGGSLLFSTQKNTNF